MAAVLRQSQSLSRASRQVIEAASFSHILARRPAALPRPLYASARSRFYSTPKSDSKDANDKTNVTKRGKTSKDADDKTNATRRGKTSKATNQDVSHNARPAKGMEGLYGQNGPMSPASQSAKPADGNTESTSQPPKDDSQVLYQLTDEQKEHLQKTHDLLKKGMPKSMAADIDKMVNKMTAEGLPKEHFELLEEIRKDGMTPARAAKLWRILSTHTRKLFEETVVNSSDGETTGQQKQQTKSEPGPGNSKTEGSQSKKTQGIGGMDWGNAFIFALTGTILLRLLEGSENSKEITWQEFKTTFLDKGLVEKLVVINGNRVRAYLLRESVANQYPDSPAAKPGFFYTFSIGSVEAFERRVDEAQDQLAIPSADRLPISYNQESDWGSIFLSFAPTLLFVGIMLYVSRRVSGGAGTQGGNGIFGMGRSRAKKFNVEEGVKVKFSDVAGMDEAKQEIMEFVSFLKEPQIYQKLGAKIPRGAILSGPPGTGKTLLAKATAGESGVPFFSVSGSEFVEMFVGVGPSRVRDLFANARKTTPCIIFIDEIDAIGKSRSKSNFGGGNDERESTLNQILTEMDGFNTSDQVVVLAGTNRPDVLDKALMRPGRFDRHITIDPPTMEGRKQIFGVHLTNIVTSENLDHLKGRLAALTPGFAGADIANVVNEAALIAARNKAETVSMTHFEQAIERVIGGLEKKSMVLSPEEKKTVAYHEAGHAICGWYFQYADPLLKVSIIPRGSGALGYAQYLPAGGGDAYLMTVRSLMDRMAMTLGGRVSEELHFDTVTSGASDDFNKVTRMATAMVTKWGMSSKIGFIYYPDSSESADAQLHKPFSEETAKEIDKEVRRMIDEAYKQCRELLVEKKKEVGLVAEELLRKEMLTRDDMVRLLGPRPYEDKGEFSKYFGGGAASSPGAGGEGRTPGGIGDSPPAPPGLGDVPPPTPLGGGGGAAAPALFKEQPRRQWHSI